MWSFITWSCVRDFEWEAMSGYVNIRKGGSRGLGNFFVIFTVISCPVVSYRGSKVCSEVGGVTT